MRRKAWAADTPGSCFCSTTRGAAARSAGPRRGACRNRPRRRPPSNRINDNYEREAINAERWRTWSRWAGRRRPDGRRSPNPRTRRRRPTAPSRSVFGRFRPGGRNSGALGAGTQTRFMAVVERCRRCSPQVVRGLSVGALQLAHPAAWRRLGSRAVMATSCGWCCGNHTAARSAPRIGKRRRCWTVRDREEPPDGGTTVRRRATRTTAAGWATRCPG